MQTGTSGLFFTIKSSPLTATLLSPLLQLRSTSGTYWNCIGASNCSPLRALSLSHLWTDCRPQSVGTPLVVTMEITKSPADWHPKLTFNYCTVIYNNKTKKLFLWFIVCQNVQTQHMIVVCVSVLQAGDSVCAQCMYWCRSRPHLCL